MFKSTVGTSIYGNYHGYYKKRPSASDPRLALLPSSLFEGRRVLDVGCNEGLVTCEIAQKHGAVRVIGVDIDDTLVRAAWKHRRSAWSQQGPSSVQTYKNGQNRADDDPPSKWRRVYQSDAHPGSDSGDTTFVNGVADYFPSSCEHMYGPLPIPEAGPHHDDGAAHIFPHNVSFRAADWVNCDIPEDAEGYHIVVAFSVSKWIHLNGGDEGLLTFFRRVYKVLRPGGTFVLEPQEWDTYAKAKRMDPILKETAKGLQLRPEEFERVLKVIGFRSAEHLGCAGEGGFRRPIDLYVKM